MYVPIWLFLASLLLVGWQVYRYCQFKQKAQAAEREARRELEARPPSPFSDNWRYSTEDIAKLLAKGGGAGWHEEQAGHLRAQHSLTERQRRDLAFHEESAAAIRRVAAEWGSPELADR